jgi:diguanylate cyclase (GGDEF)-like protein
MFRLAQRNAECGVAAGSDEAEKTVTTTMSFDLRRRSDSQRFTLPTLRVVAGPDMLRFCSVYPEESVTIGRDETCDLVLHDASVSRRHAVIQADALGDLTLRDLGSTNGTSRNGERVAGAATVPLHPGDHVEIGGVTLRVDRLGLDELAHLNRVVERLDLANKDPLTGLATRLFLDEELPAVMQRHDHARVPISAIFIDVDHFKRVNDSFGHGVGDEVLRAVARLIALTVRDSDTCVRYGGEELLVLLPNSDEAGGMALAERIRGAVHAHTWNHYAEGLRITVSCGVAQRQTSESQRDWLNRADRAVYAAKAAGRDRSCAASTLPSE